MFKLYQFIPITFFPYLLYPQYPINHHKKLVWRWFVLNLSFVEGVIRYIVIASDALLNPLLFDTPVHNLKTYVI